MTKREQMQQSLEAQRAELKAWQALDNITRIETEADYKRVMDVLTFGRQFFGNSRDRQMQEALRYFSDLIEAYDKEHPKAQ